MKLLSGVLIALVLALPLMAQEDTPVSELIDFDLPVSETLSERAFWDWWRVEALEGDIIVAEMQAGEALEPLLGILGPDGVLAARSDDGEPGGSVTLEYTAPAMGEYIVVATRVGNENGTSTGPYDLLIRRANPVPVRVNPYHEVAFRCQDYEVTSAVTMAFNEDLEQAGPLVISVYGLDGFEPVIRVHFEAFDLTDCSRDVQAMANNVYQLPGEAPVTLQDEIEGTGAQLFITSMADLGEITLTIGSADGSTGRYIAVIAGFTIGDDDRDTLAISQGPLAATEALLIYMVAAQDTRLDPSLRVGSLDDDLSVCDDAGRRGCEGVPSPVGLYVYLAESGIELEADRFDAGVVLAPAPPEVRQVELSSFSNRTSGPYAIILIGELPARD